MNFVKKQVFRVFFWLTGFIPQTLPAGRDAHKAYGDRIFMTYNLPDFASYRQCLATMIMHLKPTVHMARPYYFYKCIKKAQANQVAYDMIQELKEEADKASGEVTPESKPNVESISDARVSKT